MTSPTLSIARPELMPMLFPGKSQFLITRQEMADLSRWLDRGEEDDGDLDDLPADDRREPKGAA